MWQKLMVLVACAGSCIAPAQAKDQCVIVLHGLARTASSMAHLADVLSAEGYTVVNPGYPSTQAPIEELAGTTVGEALMQCPAQAQVQAQALEQEQVPVQALEGIFKAALYDFATGSTPMGFEQADMRSAYRAL